MPGTGCDIGGAKRSVKAFTFKIIQIQPCCKDALLDCKDGASIMEDDIYLDHTSCGTPSSSCCAKVPVIEGDDSKQQFEYDEQR